MKCDNPQTLLGTTVKLCDDPLWKAVIIAVEMRLGGEVHYKLEWRDGRGFNDKWVSMEELTAYSLLKEK